MKQINFNDEKNNLSDNDIDSILKVIGHGCRHETKKRLRSILTYGPSTIPSYGIFSRLIKENNQWEYVAGQDYVSEIKTLRNCILKG